MMRKWYVSLFVIMIMFFSGMVSVGAEDMQYGAITDKLYDYDDWGNEIVSVKMFDDTGKQIVLTCAKRVTVNGIRYREAQDIVNAIPTNVYAKYAVEEDKIVSILYDDTAEYYNAVTYNNETKTFSVLNDVTASLPVYFKYNDDYVTANLSNDCIYSLEVYDYGIFITNMTAINKKYTIEYADIGDKIDGLDYSRININVYLEMAVQDLRVRGELYNSENQLIDKCYIRHNNESEMIFYGVPNENGKYTVKLWLEDADEERVSNIYNRVYNIEQIPVYYGMCEAIAVDTDDWGNENLYVRMKDYEGEMSVFTCVRKVSIDGIRYNKPQEGCNALAVGNYYKYAVKDEQIVSMLSEDYQHYLVFKGYDNNIYRADLYVDNNTNNVVDAVAYIAIYSKEDVLKNVLIKDVRLNGYGEEQHDVVINDYSFENGDYVKAFLWNGNLNAISQSYKKDI